MDVSVYEYLDRLLRMGPVVHPANQSFRFEGGFRPVHLQCHITSAQVAVERGYPPVVGIAFLELAGKLYPWPHIVNRGPDGLVDHAPIPLQRRLGFIETSWDQWDAWRLVNEAYAALAPQAEGPRWGDASADALTDRHLSRLIAALALPLLRPRDIAAARPSPGARLNAPYRTALAPQRHPRSGRSRTSG